MEKERRRQKKRENNEKRKEHQHTMCEQQSRDIQRFRQMRAERREKRDRGVREEKLETNIFVPSNWGARDKYN